MQFIDSNGKRGSAIPDSPRSSCTQFTLELLKMGINKTASIDRFHKKKRMENSFFNDSD